MVCVVSFSRAAMFERTGCTGVSVGRGAFYNPWIFKHTREYRETGVLPPEPGFNERVKVMCRHLELMVDVFGEGHGCMMFRKVAPWYAKRFGPARMFNKQVVRVSSRALIIGFGSAVARKWSQGDCSEGTEGKDGSELFEHEFPRVMARGQF